MDQRSINRRIRVLTNIAAAFEIAIGTGFLVEAWRTRALIVPFFPIFFATTGIGFVLSGAVSYILKAKER